MDERDDGGERIDWTRDVERWQKILSRIPADDKK